MSDLTLSFMVCSAELARWYSSDASKRTGEVRNVGKSKFEGDIGYLDPRIRQQTLCLLEADFLDEPRESKALQHQPPL